MTGEELRVVTFELPRGSTEALQHLEGFEDFNPATEVLECLIAGTGTKDAPRVFGMKLDMVTHDELDFKPTFFDPKFELLRENGTLIAMCTKHIDDIKFGGTKKVILKIIQVLENTFGELKKQFKAFKNIGMNHVMLPDGSIK